MKVSGIYNLIFYDGSYYVGQSVDLDKRKKDHIRDLLLNKHVNYKLQQKYNSNKTLPIFSVIEVAEVSELNNLENKYINLQDPLCLNIKAGSDNNFGYNAPTAKYLTSDIELAFLLLVNNPGISHKDVADFVGIDINTVHDISAGRNRAATEMKLMYPNEYKKLINMKANNTRGKIQIVLEHTDGTQITLLSGQYSEFCRKYGVQTSNLSRVISGERKSTMGWKLVSKHENF